MVIVESVSLIMLFTFYECEDMHLTLCASLKKESQLKGTLLRCVTDKIAKKKFLKILLSRNTRKVAFLINNCPSYSMDNTYVGFFKMN